MHNYRAERDQSISADLRREEGRLVEEFNRSKFENSFTVDNYDFKLAIEQTTKILVEGSYKNIFNASFQTTDLRTKADIIGIRDGKLDLYEVKSSTSEKDKYIDDLAFTGLVIKKIGYKIENYFLVLISKNYRFGDNPNTLTNDYNVTEKVEKRITVFESKKDFIVTSILAENEPQSPPIEACKKCDELPTCHSAGIQDPIFDLPHLRGQRFQGLRNLDILDIRKIPEDYKLTENQEKVRNAVVSGSPYLNPNLRSLLEDLTKPYYYLDFEAISPAIPIYPNIPPFQQTPFQYSVHKMLDFDSQLEHLEYLAYPENVDCREDLLDRLIQDLETSGSIFVYSSYEKTRMNSLRKYFPQRKEAIEAIKDRFVDLEKIITGNYYHPNFHGSSSIKQVLPALVPEMSYQNLGIQEGGDASAVFLRLAKGRYEGSDVASKRKELLEYCGMDTLAMMEIHKKLWSLASKM